MLTTILALTIADTLELNYYYLFAALALAVVLVLLLRRQPRHVKAYSTDNGAVLVCRTAIVELVQSSCEQIKEVSKPRVRMRLKGGQTHFEVRLKLAAGGQLRAIENMLQAHLRRALTENLGIENLGRINIVATGFKSGRVEASSSISKKPPKARRNPRQRIRWLTRQRQPIRWLTIPPNAARINNAASASPNHPFP